MAKNRQELQEFYDAVKAGNLTRVIDLAEQVKQKDEDNTTETALTIAIDCNHYEVVKALLDNDFDPDDGLEMGDYISTPLIRAITCDKIEIAKLLIEGGANVNFHTGLFTPLACAVTEGKPYMVELLLERGADPYWTDCSGKTLYEVAEMKKLQKIFDLMKQYAGGVSTKAAISEPDIIPNADNPDANTDASIVGDSIVDDAE